MSQGSEMIAEYGGVTVGEFFSMVASNTFLNNGADAYSRDSCINARLTQERNE